MIKYIHKLIYNNYFIIYLANLFEVSHNMIFYFTTWTNPKKVKLCNI